MTCLRIENPVSGARQANPPKLGRLDLQAAPARRGAAYALLWMLAGLLNFYSYELFVPRACARDHSPRRSNIY